MNRKTILPLFLITLVYFALGFVNILTAYLALACMALPFIILARQKKKSWCQGICPRADLLSRLKPISAGRAAPRVLSGEKVKRGVLTYFCMNLFFITMSTIMVASGRMAPIDRVRFLIAFQLPWELPQLVTFDGVPGAVIHLAFRFYSLMFTSTVAGVVLALLYKPRTWCTVCPINTLSDAALGRLRVPETPGR